MIVSVSLYLQPLSRVPNPGNTLYYWENAGYFAWKMNTGAPCSPDELVNLESAPIGGWHGQAYQFTAAYVDGHAASTHIEGHIWPHPHLPYYPTIIQRDYDDAHFRFGCAVVRGENWQIDTLPAALPRTGIPLADWEGSGSGDHPVE